METVFLKRCEGYDIKTVESAIRAALDGLGIDLRRMVKGKNVLLKPNLLGAYRPEKAVTTHPVFVEGVVRVLRDCDCALSLGDSPNGVQRSLEEVWLRTGMRDLCQRYGIKEKLFEREGAVLRDGLLISNAVLDADLVINLPKFKTHGLTFLTGAVKNMFGVVPGLKKTDYHRSAASREGFAETLVKIAEVRRPALNIVDGIVSMAGNGPSGGYPVALGLIAVGRDIHTVDLALANLMDIKAGHIDTLKVASKMGLIDLRKDHGLAGDPMSSFDMSGFRLPVSYTLGFGRSNLFNTIINRCMGSLKIRPEISKERCKRCGMCVDICPVGGIEPGEDGPSINHAKCVECYCCHEACTYNAIDLKESLLLKIVKSLASKRR